MALAFVTDSTAYIPTELARKHGITVVPQVLIWGEETFRDGIDIQPDEFYARLRNTKVMPSTSQASVVTMQETFQSLADQGFTVMGVFISAKLSGTMQSAIQAREALGTTAEKVTIVDSHSTAMAMGFQVLTAARAAEQGASLEECQALVEKSRDHVGVYFAVDTLEFLHRGGRIGGAQRFIGSALEPQAHPGPKGWACGGGGSGAHEEQGFGPSARIGHGTGEGAIQYPAGYLTCKRGAGSTSTS